MYSNSYNVKFTFYCSSIKGFQGSGVLDITGVFTFYCSSIKGWFIKDSPTAPKQIYILL